MAKLLKLQCSHIEGKEITGVGRGLPALTGGTGGMCSPRGGRLMVTSAMGRAGGNYRGERGVTGTLAELRAGIRCPWYGAGGRLPVTSAGHGRGCVCVSGAVGGAGGDRAPVSRRAEHGEGHRLQPAAAGRAAVPAGPERGDMQRSAGGVPAAAGGPGHRAGVPARRARRGQARHQPKELR